MKERELLQRVLEEWYPAILAARKEFGLGVSDSTPEVKLAQEINDCLAEDSSNE